MAVIIKVLDKRTLKPKPGITVSYIRTSGFGGSGRDKTTQQDGCVIYEVDSCKAVVTIRGDRKSEQFLENGENVFYI